MTSLEDNNVVAVNVNMNSDITRSVTDTAVHPANVVGLDTSSSNAFNYLYQKLYPLAFADAVHDKVVDTGQNQQTESTHKLQCDFFNEAMPRIFNDEEIRVFPPPCKTQPLGLNIPDRFKQYTGIEDQMIGSIIYGGFIPAVIAGTNPWGEHNLINGLTSLFQDAAIYKNLYTIPDGHAIKTFNNKVYRVRSVTVPEDGGPDGFNFGQRIGLFDEPEDIKPGGVHQHNVFYLEDATDFPLLAQLKKGPQNVNAILHILMLPEYLADSATKKPWESTSLPHQSSGIKMLFAGKIQSEYPAWSDNNRNTFFSRFRCIMRVRDWNKKCVKQVWTTNTSDLLNIYNSGHALPSDEDHKCGKTDGPIQVGQTVSPLTAGEYETTFIYNPNAENNIDKIKEYLRHTSINLRLEGRVKATRTNPAGPATLATTEIRNQIQLAYQRKRSGDSMQALAIKRLQDNEHFHISDDRGGNQPTITSVGTLFNNVRRRAWLCTHDRILCSYALFLGINVLLTHERTVTSFKLISDINDNFN